MDMHVRPEGSMSACARDCTRALLLEVDSHAWDRGLRRPQFSVLSRVGSQSLSGKTDLVSDWHSVRGQE